MEISPGPASTVEERSLRKNFVRGDRGSKLAVGDFFSDAFRKKHKYLAVLQYRTSQSTLATSIGMAVAAIYYCMKRNVILKIGPMTSLPQ